MRPVVAGLVIGAAALAPFTALLGSFLFGIGRADPWSVAVGAAVLLASALAAAYIPARRATRVDPLVALRTT
jgi:ABC-type antimicrobial peptide transport system permease subunit